MRSELTEGLPKQFQAPAPDMLLTILIPTYNREKQLSLNISMLCGFIRITSMGDLIKILVSDNCSTDNTHSTVSNDIQKNSDIAISFFSQAENVGLEKNAISCLAKATTDYVMYLGDDDYITEEYLVKVVAALRGPVAPTCIIPSYQAVDPRTGVITGGRDLDMKTTSYDASYRSCLENSWRGHQLSGIVLYRHNLWEAYCARGVRNIYPFIFLVAYASLRGRLLHLAECPIIISDVSQSQKDWGYGDDGLVHDICDNYRCLFDKRRDFWKRSLLEMKLLKVQSWRYVMYIRKGRTALVHAVRKILQSKNVSIMTKILFPCCLLPSVLVYREFRIFTTRWLKI